MRTECITNETKYLVHVHVILQKQQRLLWLCVKNKIGSKVT